MTVREQVFERDKHQCRICVASRIPALYGDYPLEWAHLKARGMGGNPDDSRNVTANTIVCCRNHHTGPRSLHSGHVHWQFLSDQGADGPMVFSFCEKLPKAECGVTLEALA